MEDSSIGRILDADTIEYIKGLARQKHNEYNKLNDVIGSQIFNILEYNSRVLYYPLEDDDVWGFAEKIKGQSFVCINTSIPYDKQVFVAAHELYHLWFNGEEELILSSSLEAEETSYQINENELKANRFAAEFLVEENLLRQEMKTYDISKDNISIKEILRLSTLFLVPYKTMVRRLKEIKIFNKTSYEKFSSVSKEEIEMWRTRLSIRLPVRENKIGLDNLVDKAMELYEKKLITIEKLEYLLSFADLSIEQLGIETAPVYVPPTDEELQLIMEE